jgi:hypothetical protein
MSRVLRIVITAMVVTVAATVVRPDPARAVSGYSAGGGPWNVRYCAATQCRLTGQMPDGAIPDLICQTYGERVILGSFVTSIWNKVRTPAGVVGYLTDAGVNETPGTSFDSRIPRCGGGHGGSVYFKPRDWHPADPDANADYVVTRAGWSLGDCSAVYGGNYPDVIGDRKVTTLAGWSVGRLGPTYIMRYNMPRVTASIDSIVLYDPGSWADYFGEGGCDRQFDQSQLYATWLAARPANRLLILAGRVTRDVGHPDGAGRYHQGIQQALFPKIRGTGLAGQVLVCNYDDLDHVDVLSSFPDVVRGGPRSTCPTKAGVTLSGQWHP